MKEKAKRIEDRKGFTFVELEVTIVILVALAALVLPFYDKLNNHYQALERNNTAREIFLIAENRMTNLKAAGQTNAVYDAAYTSDVTNESNTEVWAISSDAYIYNDRTAAYLLVPDTSFQGREFLIGIREDTDTIQEVYFSKEELSTSLISDIMRGLYSGKAKETERVSAQIGYYSSNDASNRQQEYKVDFLPSPTLQVSDGQECKLLISANSSKYGGLSVNYEALIKKASATDDDGQNILTIGTGNLTINALAQEVCILDSLRPGQHFNELYASSGIRAGENVEIIVKLSCSEIYDNTVFVSSRSSMIVNPLFESVGDEEIPEVRIANGRHLQNLSYATSLRQIEVVVTDQIDWKETQTYYQDLSSGCLPFAPIVHEGIVSIAGNGKEIRNIFINDHESLNVGIFGNLKGSGSSVCANLMIADAMVSGGKETAGMLAGNVENFAFMNCQCYRSDHVICDTEEESQRIVAPDRGTVSSEASYVGGLVGRITGTGWISNCSASTVALGSTKAGCVGGLTGFCSVPVTLSYATSGARTDDGDSWYGGIQSGRFAGGLIGESNNACPDHCYVCGFVGLAGQAGGIIASGTGTVTNCISLMSYHEGYPVYGIGPAGGTDNSYRDGTAVFSEGIGTPVTLETFTRIQGSDTNWSLRNSTRSYSYLCEGLYPYCSVKGLTHFGDWPVEQQAEQETEQQAEYEEE